jgi:hypothetical protein
MGGDRAAGGHSLLKGYKNRGLKLVIVGAPICINWPNCDLGAVDRLGRFHSDRYAANHYKCYICYNPSFCGELRGI